MCCPTWPLTAPTNVRPLRRQAAFRPWYSFCAAPARRCRLQQRRLYTTWLPPDATLAARGGIPQLARLISSGNAAAAHPAAAALQNMDLYSRNSQQAFITAGGIPPLVQLLHSGNEAVQAAAAGALHNLCANDDSPQAVSAAGGIPALVQLLRSDSAAVQIAAAGALYNLACSNLCYQQAIVAEGGTTLLERLMSSGNEEVQAAANKALMALRGELGVTVAASAPCASPPGVCGARVRRHPQLAPLRRLRRSAVLQRGMPRCTLA